MTTDYPGLIRHGQSAGGCAGIPAHWLLMSRHCRARKWAIRGRNEDVSAALCAQGHGRRPGLSRFCVLQGSVCRLSARRDLAHVRDATALRGRLAEGPSHAVPRRVFPKLPSDGPGLLRGRRRIQFDGLRDQLLRTGGGLTGGGGLPGVPREALHAGRAAAGAGGELVGLRETAAGGPEPRAEVGQQRPAGGRSGRRARAFHRAIPEQPAQCARRAFLRLALWPTVCGGKWQSASARSADGRLAGEPLSKTCTHAPAWIAVASRR